MLTHKKKRWLSAFVGIVGIVTIVGLTDLMFLLPDSPSAPVFPDRQASGPVFPDLTPSSGAQNTPTVTTTPFLPDNDF